MPRASSSAPTSMPPDALGEINPDDANVFADARHLCQRLLTADYEIDKDTSCGSLMVPIPEPVDSAHSRAVRDLIGQQLQQLGYVYDYAFDYGEDQDTGYKGYVFIFDNKTDILKQFNQLMEVLPTVIERLKNPLAHQITVPRPPEPVVDAGSVTHHFKQGAKTDALTTALCIDAFDKMIMGVHETRIEILADMKDSQPYITTRLTFPNTLHIADQRSKAFEHPLISPNGTCTLSDRQANYVANTISKAISKTFNGNPLYASICGLQEQFTPTSGADIAIDIRFTDHHDQAQLMQTLTSHRNQICENIEAIVQDRGAYRQ